MYVQITTKCNMECPHCGYSCKIGEGQHMSKGVWQDTLKFLDKNGEDSIAIGGGEPTLHPDFWHILIDCLALKWADYVWLATNGKKTEMAIKLAHMAKKGLLGVALSVDSYHEIIDEEVYEAFGFDIHKYHPHSFNPEYYQHKKHSEDDYRELKFSRKVIHSGRGKEISHSDVTDCICDEKFIKPNGKIHLCGCEESPEIGNVWDGIQTEWEQTDYCCIKEINKKEKGLEME